MFDEYLPPKDSLPEFIYTLPELRYPQKLNTAYELVDRNVIEGRRNHVAIFFEDRRITYGELEKLVNKLGNGLKGLGVNKRDRVLIRVYNTPELVVSNLAIQKVGAISVPTNPLLKGRELSMIANDSEAKVLIVSSELLQEVEKVRGELTTVKQIVVIGGGGLKEKGYVDFTELIETSSKELKEVETDKDDYAVMLYSTGTTGPQKGTLHTHAENLAIADTFARYILNVREDDVLGGYAVMGLSYGHGIFSVFPYRFGAAASLMRRFKPEDAFKTIENHGVTIFFGSVTAYRLMLSIKDAEKKYDLSSLRLCISSAEPLPRSVYDEWKRRFNVEILNGMGTTEMHHRFVCNRPGTPKPESLGLPVPGFDVKIFDEEGRECPPNVVGYLAVRGPTGTRYWKRRDEQKRVVRNGWNYVGDIAYKDEDGYIWYVSRSDDIIKSAGYTISPYEVEATLKEHSGVLECAVIGVPDPLRGQRVKAFVVLKDCWVASASLKEELINFCRERIAPFKVPSEVEFVSELPKDEMGKVSRVKLRRLCKP